MTTPGERHALLLPLPIDGLPSSSSSGASSRDLSPSGVPLPPDTDDGEVWMERRRRRAASVGVEGAMGFGDGESSSEEEEGREGREGALRRRRGTIRPGEGAEMGQ